MLRVVCLAFLFSASVLACAQQPLYLGRKLPEARNLVRNYLELDYRGARLSPEPDKKLLALTTWKSDPEWQALTLVSQYEITDVRASGLKHAVVIVNYTVLGRYEPGIGFTPDTEPQSEEFTLDDQDSGWRILESDPPVTPHVSKQSLVQWLKTALPKEKDPMRKVAMQNTLSQLDTPAAPAAPGH